MLPILRKVSLDTFFTVIGIAAGICGAHKEWFFAGLLIAVLLVAAIIEAAYVATHHIPDKQ